MPSKPCTKCGIVKPFVDFYAAKASKSGYQSACKACTIKAVRENTEKNAERVSEYQKQYRVENREKSIARSAAYYAANKSDVITKNAQWQKDRPEKAAAYRANHYQKNKERFREKHKDWFTNNPKKQREYCAQWQMRNPEKVRIKSMNRKASKSRSTPLWADIEAMTEFHTVAQMFRLYTGVEYQVDHIVPLRSKSVCGLNVPANLQVLTYSENARKGNRWWPDMWGAE